MSIRFGNLCRQRWGLTDQEVDDRWNTGLADVNVPKGTDEEGWTTMAKYALHSLESSRELSHGRHISKSDQVEAEPHQLRNIAGSNLELLSSNFTLYTCCFVVIYTVFWLVCLYNTYVLTSFNLSSIFLADIPTKIYFNMVNFSRTLAFLMWELFLTFHIWQRWRENPRPKPNRKAKEKQRLERWRTATTNNNLFRSFSFNCWTLFEATWLSILASLFLMLNR